jgi:hypothetical protein
MDRLLRPSWAGVCTLLSTVLTAEGESPPRGTPGERDRTGLPKDRSCFTRFGVVGDEAPFPSAATSALCEGRFFRLLLPHR